MISVRVQHRGFLIKVSKDLVVSPALLKVLISSLVAASDEVDNAGVFTFASKSNVNNKEFAEQ